jgi:hypothetical protein
VAIANFSRDKYSSFSPLALSEEMVDNGTEPKSKFARILVNKNKQMKAIPRKG